MNYKFSTRSSTRLLMGLSMALVAMSVQAGDKSIDCDKEVDDQDAIQKTLDGTRAGDNVLLSGSCDGLTLVMAVPGVSLQGPAQLSGTGAGPVVRVEDAGNVSLTDLNLTGGTIGLEVANARVIATGVDSSSNLVDGFSVVQSSALECNDCSASSNGNRGLLVAGTTVLCGNTSFDSNTVSGALAFLGGRLFSSADICGGPPSISLSGNQLGLTLFQEAAVFFDEVTLTVTAVSTAVNVIDSSLTVRRSQVALDNSGVLGLNVADGSTARINDDPPSVGTGSTSIQGNGALGVQAINNSQVVLGNATVTGHPFIDLFVTGFSLANQAGATTVGAVSCAPGQSGGSLCFSP